MGKGRSRAVEQGVLGHAAAAAGSGGLPGVPQAPVFHPTEEEFRDPIEYISKIRPEAEPFGICRIVPPPSWNPPFALDLQSFSFPTKTQAIHRLQARPASCDPRTFHLDYGRFLESRLGRKPKRRGPVFEGADLDLSCLFTSVRRFGGYSKVCREKRWGDISRFVRPSLKVTECSKHVLSQLYLEHLFDYEEYHSQLSQGKTEKEEDSSASEGQSAGPDRKRRKSSGGGRDKNAGVKELDQICEQCKSGLHGEVMLLCDRCDKGWHLHCLSPPLESVPTGNWYCLECVNSDKDSFGFVPGKPYSLETFKRIDDRAKRKWLGLSRATRSQVEKRFWEIVEGRAGEVNVKYGNDLDTSIYGSGFPRPNDPMPPCVDPDLWRKYSSSPWNLNNLPRSSGSLLRVVRDNITGVMVPWLYIGMLFSSFCWHVEDHCLYSINYLHWGEPKCWYGVPGREANTFEKVMRDMLPDLFEAQPDLLFQLVTMLSPSVLQENGVPVYGVLQEPGNFVITFPRSFHGGFNFGLNCAEAVNFASADWLPHGGFGAEMYRLYHKAAVLSHEELLCVVAKKTCDTKVLPYLKEEMHRIYAREKRCREELWKNGTVRSSLMPLKKHPMHVGNEEDPTCVICQQYLYLSAITCSCRPSAFVCLEHRKHLCECNPSKHRLLYRHSLAELGELVYVCNNSGTSCDTESSQSRNSLQHQLFRNESSNISKKVKGELVTYSQLAEDWLSNACHILEVSFSTAAYTNLLEESEQFLWADHDMDPVRDMVKRLIEVQKWAMDLRNSLSQVQDWFSYNDKQREKLAFLKVDEMLSHNPFPCCISDLAVLKVYAEDARMLGLEIDSALSSRLCINELERIHSRAIEFPLKLEATEVLATEISSAKILMNNARGFLSAKKPAVIDIDNLNKLKSEMLKIRVQLPEMDLLLNMCREVESLQLQCRKILAGTLKLKELEEFLHSVDDVIVSIPELELLRQCLCDAYSWLSHLHAILQNLEDREDHAIIVAELSCSLKDGELLRVQVDELPLVEAELNKSRCREKASKVLAIQMPLEFIQQLLAEASLLEIEDEKMFIEISRVLREAFSCEERANFVLEQAAQMLEFEDVVRTSENIFAIIPSLPKVKNAIKMAQSWITRSQPYLLLNARHDDVSKSLLKVDDLKELVSQAKFLKVTIDDLPERLKGILDHVEGWKCNAHSLLEISESLLYMNDAFVIFDDQLPVKIEELLNRIIAAREFGQSMGFEFTELMKLEHVYLLKWCLKALSLSSTVPLLKDVAGLLEEVDHLPATFSGSNLTRELIRGAGWLRKASIILLEHRSFKRWKVKDVEEILDELQKIVVPCPLMVARLRNAIEKHESWIEKMHDFFTMNCGQTWSLLMKLQEVGRLDAFDCPELHKVTSEIKKVEKWMVQCLAVVDPLVGDLGSLYIKLVKIREMMERALCIFRASRGYRTSTMCTCCPNHSENEQIYTCLTCGDRYHFSCMGPPLASAGLTNEYACPFCFCMESGAVSPVGGNALICRGNRPELKSLIELLSISEDFYSGFEERTLVGEIVKQALECRTYLTEIVARAFSIHEKDISSISESLLCALKAIAVAGVYDHQDRCNLEAAFSRNSWKIRVKKLFDGSKKPTIQQVQCLLKEGLAVGLSSEDHFMQEITKAKQISLKWVDEAKKVAFDLGTLELSEVFKLMSEGEALLVHFEKEMKLLRERSILYCICRKPYDQRAMVACDQCDEWYHFECINLDQLPSKSFYCPACKPVNGEFLPLPRSRSNEERANTNEEPRTPPACHNGSELSISKRRKSSLQQKMLDAVDLKNILRSHGEIDHLWNGFRRPLKRTARKRIKFESLRF